jgi:hypothetical protein
VVGFGLEIINVRNHQTLGVRKGIICLIGGNGEAAPIKYVLYHMQISRKTCTILDY